MSTAPIEMEDSYTVMRGEDNSWNYELNSRAPVRLTWKQMVRVTLHWRCLILTVFLFTCFSLLIWCQTPVTLPFSSIATNSCRNGLIWVPATITMIFYLLYLIECFHCNIHKGFENLISTGNAELILNRWRNAKAVIRWRAVCYHYGRNLRQRYHAGSGGAQTIPQLQYSRINSHSMEGRYFPYDCGCLDKSTLLKDISEHSIIKVDIEKTFSFGCSCSEAAYFTQRKAFYERHATIDDFIELSEIFHLAGSQIPDSICIVSTEKGVPWYSNKCVYWLFSLFCLSWPIRIAIERRTAYAAVTIHKEFGGNCDGVLATSGHSISSYDSKISENIYGVIPSYSEALLMSSYTLNGTRIPSTITISNKRKLKRPVTHDATRSQTSLMSAIQSYDQVTSSTRHQHGHKPTQAQKKMYISKTADNLLCLQLSGGRYNPLPRSHSLHSPISERAETSLCLETIPMLVSQRCDPVQNALSTQRHTSSSNVMNTIKQILTPTQRSKTFDEGMALL